MTIEGLAGDRRSLFCASSTVSTVSGLGNRRRSMRDLAGAERLGPDRHLPLAARIAAQPQRDRQHFSLPGETAAPQCAADRRLCRDGGLCRDGVRGPDC
jgi:hypothetical protein